jgi:hypothetical protein
MSAILEPAGSGVAGVQPKGITQQYQLAATNSCVDTSTGITPRDSGTILGNVPPGKVGEKLVNGTVQRSNQLKCDATPGVVGNALVGIAGVGVAVPVTAAGAHPADGLSGAPQRE